MNARSVSEVGGLSWGSIDEAMSVLNVAVANDAKFFEHLVEVGRIKTSEKSLLVADSQVEKLLQEKLGGSF
jgi:hypothetical protein